MALETFDQVMVQSGEDSNSASRKPAQRRQGSHDLSTRTTTRFHLASFILVCCLWSSSQPLSSAHSNGLLSDELEDSSRQEQLGTGGSWSHWWSYDGISGPDYWNINKHWRLCASGRKQSPVNIRTERLVYDHLLGPLRVHWQQQQRKLHQEDRNEKSNQTIPVKLINSGRGIEVWLERTSELSLIDSVLPAAAAGATQTATKIDHNGEKLLLSKGPLSYEYKLFKIELHSAASGNGANRFASAGQTISAATDGDEIANEDEQDDDDVGEREQENSLGDNNNNGLNPDDANKLGVGSRRKEPGERLPEAMRSARSSEHLIDGRSFEAELQLHFHNRHLASSGHEALRQANERPLASLFAVISVLISLKPNRSDQKGGASGISFAEPPSGPLDFVLDHLDQVQNQGDSIELKLSRAQLEALITDRRQYVTYSGSMNRPPCAESVDWIILNRPLRVLENKFLQLFDKLNTNQENVRPTRQLNNRLLRTTISNLRYKRSPSSSSSDGGGELEKCQKANCNLTTRLSFNRTRSWPGGANQLDTIRRKHPNKALHQQHQQQQQQCSMKPNYVYEFTYS